MAARVNIGAQERRDMVGAYNAGWSIRKIAGVYEVSYNTVHYHLERAGVQFRQRRLSDEDRAAREKRRAECESARAARVISDEVGQEMIRRYLVDGWSIARIGYHHKKSARRTREHLISSGVTLRGPGGAHRGGTTPVLSS